MLLINGKRKDDGLPKLSKPVKFELTGGFTFESPTLVTQAGEKYIRKNKIFKLPTTYTAYDESANRNVEYRYAVQEIPVSDGKGGMSNRYTPNRVVFTSTVLVVHPNQPDLYEFLIKSPWIDNGKNTSARFKEVDAKKDAVSKIELETKKIKAKSLILHDEKMLPEATLRRILSELDKPFEGDIEIVKEMLLPFAEKDPEKFLKVYSLLDGNKKTPSITGGRDVKEVRLKELADNLGEPDMKKGFHLLKDEKLDAKLADAEARWKTESTFRQFVETANGLFEEKKYEESKGFYEDALNIKKTDKHCKERTIEISKQLQTA